MLQNSNRDTITLSLIFMKHAVLVQPTYNEKPNIQPLIKIVAEVATTIANQDYQFTQLIVDDESPDGTGDEVRTLQATHPFLQIITGKRKGLGAAYTRGLKYAMTNLAADVVIMMDADLQHNPLLIPAMLAKIDEGYDVILGSRYIKGGSLPSSWGRFRVINSKVANILARHIAGLSQVHDCTTGYRVIRVAGILDRVNFDHILASGYSFQLMQLAALLNKHPKIYEYPIQFAERNAGQSKVGANSQYLLDIIEFFRNAFLIRIYNTKRSLGL
jgi:dolichol-phosphate mannosyltransferase